MKDVNTRACGWWWLDTCSVGTSHVYQLDIASIRSARILLLEGPSMRTKFWGSTTPRLNDQLHWLINRPEFPEPIASATASKDTILTQIKCLVLVVASGFLTREAAAQDCQVLLPSHRASKRRTRGLDVLSVTS